VLLSWFYSLSLDAFLILVTFLMVLRAHISFGNQQRNLQQKFLDIRNAWKQWLLWMDHLKELLILSRLSQPGRNMTSWTRKLLMNTKMRKVHNHSLVQRNFRLTLITMCFHISINQLREFLVFQLKLNVIFTQKTSFLIIFSESLMEKLGKNALLLFL